MGNTTIHMNLSPESIDAAIQAIRAYTQRIQERTETLHRRVAERMAELAQAGFAAAGIDDHLSGGMRTPSVTVEAIHDNGFTLVVANGEDAVFVEFGAGVYHNVPVGSSVHPDGVRLDFAIGTYGKGRGARNVWGYMDEGGQIQLTRGTPAQMPMYNALQTVCSEVYQIAREVFA